jgi:PTS system ascorbate-specific IIA component
MVAIVVIAHEPLASALVAAAHHVYSRDPCTATRYPHALDIAADAQLPAMIDAGKALLDRVDQGQGVLVLTDVIGATPANVATRLAHPGRVAVIAGVSLPMLLRAMCYCEHCSLDALLVKALDGGTRGVQILSPPAPAPAAPAAATPLAASPLSPAAILPAQADKP